MYKILEATYHQGNLILKDKLSESLEGKQIKIIILDSSEIKKVSFLISEDMQHQQVIDNHVTIINPFIS